MGRVFRFSTSIIVLAISTTGAWADLPINTLASFNGSNGQSLEGGVALSGTTLYGAARSGGANFEGTVYSVPLSGGSPTVLASFNVTNGAHPVGNLLVAGNTLYGTTEIGGTGGSGTVYSLPITGGVPTVLTSFNQNTTGYDPLAGVVTMGNTLYGVTHNGGSSLTTQGTVYSVPTTGGAVTTLATFSSLTGSSPTGGLIESGNTLFGATSTGGANGGGTLYSLPIIGGTPTVLASFNSVNGNLGINDYGSPVGDLLLVGSTLYGTTGGDGIHNYGTVFSVPVSGGTPTILGIFDGSGGRDPSGGLLLLGNTLYGTTLGGGSRSVGTFFSVPLTGGTPTVLASFGGASGIEPNGELLLVENTFYGTTSGGNGTVFSITVPEPACLSLMAIAFPLTFRRRRV
jgi:uncharacterized repeat protein (TIGR03803 family)